MHFQDLLSSSSHTWVSSTSPLATCVALDNRCEPQFFHPYSRRKCSSEGGGEMKLEFMVSYSVGVEIHPIRLLQPKVLGIGLGLSAKSKTLRNQTLPLDYTRSSRNSQHQHPQLCKLPESTKTPARGPATYMIPPPGWLLSLPTFESHCPT